MNGHPTREEDFDLLALGVLEGDEKQAIEVHLASCRDCAQKLAEARGRMALLSLSAPSHAPSPRVKERLLRQIHEPQTLRLAPAREKSSGGAPRWWTAILIPATVALAVATFILWTGNSRLHRELQDLRATAARQADELKQTREMVDLMGAPDSVAVKLNPSPDMPMAQAHVMFNTRKGMLMYSGALPAPPPKMTYQLWLVPASGNPISEGVFSPKGNGEDLWMMPLPPGVVAKAFAVTIEPAGGMPQPTGPKVLIGAVPSAS
jgi:anti-sigma-K factor RskA